MTTTLKLYTNENFPYAVVEQLRQLGYDVLTSLEAGQANQGISDEEVLAFATAQERMVVTLNRKDFIRLHHSTPRHSGIIVCRPDNDLVQLTKRVDREIQKHLPVTNKLVRVNKL